MASKIDNRDGHRDYIMVKRQIEIFLLAMFLFWLFLSVGGFLLSEISQKTSCMGGWWFILLGLILSPISGIVSAIITIQECMNVRLLCKIIGGEGSLASWPPSSLRGLLSTKPGQAHDGRPCFYIKGLHEGCNTAISLSPMSLLHDPRSISR
jgi:hypothetical protein